MSDVIKVADLLAQFQLDAGPLLKGLEDVEIKLSETGARVVSLDALLKSLGEGANFGTKFQAQFDEIRAAAQLVHEQQIQLATQEKELQRMLVEEEKAALAEKQAARASYVAWWERTIEEQAIKEKTLMAEMKAIEKRDIADQKAERSRYQAWWERNTREMQAAQMEANASLAKNVTSSQIGQQIAQAEIAMANMGRRSGRGGNMAWLAEYFKSMTTSQAVTEMLGVKIPNAMGRILSYSAPVRAAMASIFDVVMVAAFIDVLYQVGTQVHQLVRDWEGFDEASKKAWADASAGAVRARRDLVDYHDMLRETAQAGLKGSALADQQGMDDIEKQKERGRVLEQLHLQTAAVAKLMVDAEKESKDFYKNLIMAPGMVMLDDPPATKKMKEQGDTLETLREKYKALQEQIREYSIEYGRLGEQIKRDQFKEDRSSTGRNKLRGPEDHEEPYRLPWYMGPNASESFANQVHGQRMAGLPSATKAMFNRADSGGGAQPAMIQVATNISPQFVFHGVPADIQAFMRDHAEPQLAKDIELNTRGIGARVVKALKESGMAHG